MTSRVVFQNGSDTETATGGDHEESHFHKISTEITLIVSGCTRMNGINYRTGDILVIEPGDKTDFLAIEDTVTCVVKVPSALGDKYLTKDNPL